MDITYGEIKSTGSALGQTMAQIDGQWDGIGNFIKKEKRFIFIGCGSSYLLAKSFASIGFMHTGKPTVALAAGDVMLHAKRYYGVFNGAAVVCISRSGKTSEILMALDAMKGLGCVFNAACLVCADNTPLEAKCGAVLSAPWAFDTSVCQTRCVTHFYFTAAYTAAKYAQHPLTPYESVVKQCVPFLENVLEPLAKGLASRDWNHAVVLADAELDGLAEEGALAFKEICQLPSNYYHVLDVRHGPMVLINDKTLVIAAVGDNPLELALLKDAAAKGAELAVLTDRDLGLSGGKTREVCFGCPLPPMAKGVPFIMLCQIIAYYKSKATGADPDKPTGLSPWISL
jgi:fructoselysine-6-P-deglycase FrlB-like protein